MPGWLSWIWPPLLIAIAVAAWIRGRRRWGGFRRFVLATALVAMFFAGSGGLYEKIGETLDDRTYAAPGKLVETGGRTLHLNCTGSGSPTVVLEAMSGGMSPVWGWIQPQVADQTRVCSYDRPGRAWSDSAESPQDADQVAAQLTHLLDNAGEKGPYVMVGHSLGGLYIRSFAAQNPGEVAGMVLLDSAHPEQFERVPELEAQYESFRNFQVLFSPLAQLGVWRLYFDAGGNFDFGGLPPEERSQMKAFWSSPKLFRSQRFENDAVRDIYRQVRPLISVGDIPLMVISAGEQSDDWLELQADLVSLSTNSTRRTIDGATHTSLVFDPETASEVAESILEVVGAAKTGGRLEP